MTKGKRVLPIALLLFSLCLVGWLFIQRVYWPRVAQPSTVAAALAGDLQLLETLHQRGMSLDYDDPRMFLWTALMAAIYGRHTNVVAYLLEKGVDLEARDAHGNTALMLAVDVADTSLTVIEMLVRAGARIDVTNEYGRTALDAVQASAERHRILGIVSRHQRSNGRLNPIPTH